MIHHTEIIDYNSFDQINYDQLKNIMKMTTSIIFANDFEMDEHDKKIFLNYEFESLTHLDLSNQNIDDEFVQKLCESDNLKKIKSINFSNTDVTKKTIKHLLRYDNVCCEGDIRISGKYGKPIAEIDVNVFNTNITKKDIDYYSVPKFDHMFRGNKCGTVYAVKELNICY